jgi:hypothetical protein
MYLHLAAVLELAVELLAALQQVVQEAEVVAMITAPLAAKEWLGKEIMAVKVVLQHQLLKLAVAAVAQVQQELTAAQEAPAVMAAMVLHRQLLVQALLTQAVVLEQLQVALKAQQVQVGAVQLIQTELPIQVVVAVVALQVLEQLVVQGL